MIALRTDMKLTLMEVITEEMDGTLSGKSQEQLCDALLDRIDLDFGLIDRDEDEDEADYASDEDSGDLE